MSETVRIHRIVRKAATVGESRVDRRVERTLSALLHAFVALVSEENYRAVTIARIVERANVGRSTFYDHFRTKDDVLLASMEWMFAILADTTDAATPSEEIEELVRHFWSNRQLAKVVLAPPVEGKLRRALAARIDDRLGRSNRWAGNPTGRKIASLGIAAAQLGLLGAWTRGEVSADASMISAAIRDTARR